MAKVKAKPAKKAAAKKPVTPEFPFLFFGADQEQMTDVGYLIHFHGVVTPKVRKAIAKHVTDDLMFPEPWEWGETWAVMPLLALSDMAAVQSFLRAAHDEAPIREVAAMDHYETCAWTEWSLAKQPKGPSKRPKGATVTDDAL